MMIAIDVEDSKDRVQIWPLQARRAKAPSYPLCKLSFITLVILILYPTTFWNHCSMSSHMGIDRGRSTPTENMCRWGTCKCGVPLEDTYCVAAVWDCKLSPAVGPPTLDTAGWQTRRVTGGTLLGVLNGQGRRCRHSARWWEVGWNSGCLMCLMHKVHQLAGLPSPCPRGMSKAQTRHHSGKRQDWEWGRIHNTSRHIISTMQDSSAPFLNMIVKKLGNKQEEKTCDQGTITEFKHQWLPD